MCTSVVVPQPNLPVQDRSCMSDPLGKAVRVHEHNIIA